MAKDSFESWDEMSQYFCENYEDVSDGTGFIGGGAGSSKVTQSIRSHTEIRKIVQELMREIRNVCSSPPWNLHYIFYTNPMTIVDQPDGTIVVTLPFTEAAYRRNMFDTHYSFIPILMDMGWRVRKIPGIGGKPSSGDGVTAPTFEYFAGSGELTRVLDEFNARYASKGFHAELVFDSSKPYWYGWA